MAETPLTKRLGIKPGHHLLILNAPDHYIDLLSDLPTDVTVSYEPDGQYDFVHLFVKQKAELDALGTTAFAAVKPGGLLWISYPKRSAKIETDMTRDKGWETVGSAGLEGVTQISIDNTWSALRFKPVGEIKTLTRKHRLTDSQGAEG